ncbi:DNA alkylation repair protein [Dokdonia pacifica]|uniref:3-methyladenine DNA glycosylase AlkC n=1 Tax=Dokdonia pacifica TaxID=1627892 RepID=A0A238Z1S8_9FLAO|nr:DNA alkylation repair protein [Dokdonia pacifica]GGG08930.1 DNA alkylation repair protein [Dokdonia pacifica]SNR76898.1 3-methyladenine DNA glycosylase AlkC [Dokdonia pacifica]
MIPEHIVNRKGPRSLKDLNPEVLAYLNAGKVETKNLMEWLAVDQLALLKTVLEPLDKMAWYSSFEVAVHAQKKPTANSNTKVIGETFAQLSDTAFAKAHLATHSSDIVRCWACWTESLFYDTTATLLTAMQPYAADAHFGLREVVIFATKERLIDDLETAITILTKWAKSTDENVRRYAAEVLRPVGVWTKKIPQLQEHPERGLPILELLKSDTSKYVRDSVGNWLNDASKSQPDWVQSIHTKWQKGTPSKETLYILKKGMRTIEKNR